MEVELVAALDYGDSGGVRVNAGFFVGRECLDHSPCS